MEKRYSKQAYAIKKHAHSTFHPREPQKYLRNITELLHPLLTVSSDDEVGWLFRSGH